MECIYEYTLDNEALVMAAFNQAFDDSEYKISTLFLKRKIWIAVILPFLKNYDTKNNKYNKLANVIEHYLENGWTIGIENPENKKLNQMTYDENDMTTDYRLAIAKDLTTNLLNGKCVKWFGDVNGILPLFADIKKLIH